MGDQNQLAARASDRDIQTAVVEDKAGSAGTDERQDHDIALAALKPLHRIDGDTCSVEHLAQQHDLSAEWRDHADRFRQTLP